MLHDSLPFTGHDLLLVIGLGALALAAGALVRVGARRQA